MGWSREDRSRGLSDGGGAASGVGLWAASGRGKGQGVYLLQSLRRSPTYLQPASAQVSQFGTSGLQKVRE